MEFEAYLSAVMRRPGIFQPGHAEKEEALREDEILLQNPVTIKHVLRVGQQSLVGAEPWERYAAGRQPANFAIDGHIDTLEVLRQPQVQRAGDRGIAAEIEVE